MVDQAKYGGAVFDKELMLRAASAGDLDETETGSAVEVGPTPAEGATARIVVPQATGTDPTVTVEIQVCATSGGTFVTVAQSEEITAAGEYAVRFATQKSYVKHKATVGGTTPDFGAVEIGVVPHGI
jgi:hypothetical protein